MTEHRFYPAGIVPPVSTYEFHEHRERAPHLEQPMHEARLRKVAECIKNLHPQSVVDLGCGDGGLLSLIKNIPSWGYDFQPSNEAGWKERGVAATQLDFIADKASVVWGELVVMTEVLEHLADPHAMVELASKHAKYIVASSPFGETLEYHAEEHAWGWDREGYENLFNLHWTVLDHFTLNWCQILTARSKNV